MGVTRTEARNTQREAKTTTLMFQILPDLFTAYGGGIYMTDEHIRDESVAANPFADADGVGAVDVASRLGMVEHFNLDQCRAAMMVPNLQKTVEKKLRGRIRRLEMDRRGQ